MTNWSQTADGDVLVDESGKIVCLVQKYANGTYGVYDERFIRKEDAMRHAEWFYKDCLAHRGME